MTRTAADGAARLLAVLAVLLGLLAMHGLAEPHHAAAATPAAQTAAHVPGDHAQHAPPPAGDASAAPSSPAPDHDAGPVLLCLAVLTAAALALLLGRRPGRSTATALRPPVAVLRAPPLPLPRGPDPVRELCVSRT